MGPMNIQVMNNNLPRPIPPQAPQAIYQAPSGPVFEEENPYM